MGAVRSGLSRRVFVQGGGALVVGFALARAARLPPIRSSRSAHPTPGRSTRSSRSMPTTQRRSGRAASSSGRGSTTGLLVLVAEELELALERLVFVRHDTDVTPNTGGTFGSSSISFAGQRLRSAAATARQALLALASCEPRRPACRSLTVSERRRLGRRPDDRPTASSSDEPAVSASRWPRRCSARARRPRRRSPPTTRRPLPRPRLDIPAKVMGTYAYIHSVRVPGMLHGRVVRPLGQGAYGDGTLAGILSVDESSIAGLGDARVVRRGELPRCRRQPGSTTRSRRRRSSGSSTRTRPRSRAAATCSGQMRALDAAGQTAAGHRCSRATSARRSPRLPTPVAATYAFHYQGHVPIGPSCAVADVTPNGAVVLGNTQDAYTMRAQARDDPRVSRRTGSGSCTGRARARSGTGPARFDAGEAAAVMSQLAGAPVRLQFMRWDEHGWDNYGPGDARRRARGR